MPARILLIAAIAVFSQTAGAADNAAIIARWYEALVAVDRPALAGMLDDGAVIRLEDIGIEQNRDEFLASLDEWETAAEGAAIRHRVESAGSDVTTVLACYDFPENDILIRETFAIAGAVITQNTQVTVADSCDAF